MQRILTFVNIVFGNKIAKTCFTEMLSKLQITFTLSIILSLLTKQGSLEKFHYILKGLKPPLPILCKHKERSPIT